MKRTKLTKKEVFNVAIAQIYRKGKTSTLAVKKKLRKYRFFGFQEQVSNLMHELSSEGKLTCTNDPTRKFQDFGLPTKTVSIEVTPSVILERE